MYDPFKEVRKINIPLENLKTQINLANNIQKQFESQIDISLLKSEIYAPQKELIESIERMSDSMLELHRFNIERTLDSIRFASKVINDYPLSIIHQLNEAMRVRITPSLNIQYSALISEMMEVPQFNVSKALETIEERYVTNTDNQYNLDATRFKRSLPITYAVTEGLLTSDIIFVLSGKANFLIDHIMIIATLYCLALLIKGYEEEHKNDGK